MLNSSYSNCISSSAQVLLKKADLAAFENYLTQLLAFTEAEIKAGKSKEEFLKATAIPGVTEWQGDGIKRSLEAAWAEVVEGK